MTTISAPPTGGYARLLSIAGHRGSRVVTNAEMCESIDSSDEWIQQRTGITERRWAMPDETVLTMGVDVSRQAIERAGIDPSEIDMVMVATVSAHRPSPALAPELATVLGLRDVPAFDVSAACAGFCYLIELARSMIAAGTVRHVLITATERLSDMIDMNDRSTAFLFGDGAGAAVVGISDTPGISQAIWGSDGSRRELIGAGTWPDAIAAGRTWPSVSMDGQNVFRWATTEVAPKTLEALALAGLAPSDLDAFIAHQANNRITDAMLRRLDLPERVLVSRDIRIQGNTSAASVPLAMTALMEEGEAKPGDLALLVGFGAGLAYASQVITLPQPR